MTPLHSQAHPSQTSQKTLSTPFAQQPQSTPAALQKPSHRFLLHSCPYARGQWAYHACSSHSPGSSPHSSYHQLWWHVCMIIEIVTCVFPEQHKSCNPTTRHSALAVERPQPVFLHGICINVLDERQTEKGKMRRRNRRSTVLQGRPNRWVQLAYKAIAQCVSKVFSTSTSSANSQQSLLL